MHETFDELSGHLRCTNASRLRCTRQRRTSEEEIRMFAALGAVTAFDDWAPKLLAEGPPDVIHRELREWWTRSCADDLDVNVKT